jgi:hypothetical protein
VIFWLVVRRAMLSGMFVQGQKAPFRRAACHFGFTSTSGCLVTLPDIPFGPQTYIPPQS